MREDLPPPHHPTRARDCASLQGRLVFSSRGLEIGEDQCGAHGSACLHTAASANPARPEINPDAALHWVGGEGLD